MNLLRRKFVSSAVFVGAMAATASVGILLPRRTLAAYSKDAFAARDINAALTAAMGTDQHSASDQIKLKAPDIAENGAVVPVTVSARIGNVEAISIIAASNQAPLTSSYQLSAASEPFVSTRIKMSSTAEVIAVLKADGKLFSTSKEVKVTIGGCGG